MEIWPRLKLAFKRRALATLARRGIWAGRTPDGRRLDHTLGFVLRTCKIGAVLDVGANAGQYAEMLRSQCGWQGPICSFEPVPENFDALRASMSSDPRWSGFPWALGDSSGELAMAHFPGSSVFDSALPPSDLGVQRFPHLTAWQEHRVAVPVYRLDEVFDQVLGPELADAVVHLKIDTQGFDQRVLEGARNCLDRVASLQIELAALQIYQGVSPMPEMLELCDELGFDLAGLFPIARTEDGLRVLEFDGLFVRRGL